MPQKMIQSIYHFHSKEGNTMNKIYKVIWSKAKHTYVVASEIAKGHTKGETTGKGLKKLAAAMLVAAALMGPNFAWAADTVTVNDTSTVQQTVYTKDGADNTFVKKDSDTALHISRSGDLIVGTKKNQTVKDMEIRGKLTSGSISTGGITSTGEVTVKGKMAADGVTDDTTKDGTYIKHNNTVGKNLGSLDTQVKANADAINEEARKRKYSVTNLENADKQLQTNIDNEAVAREAGDKTLDDRITAVKEYVLKETGDNYVSKADAAVQDAGVVKADKKIGENVTALGKGLYDETAARIGADKAQDAVIQQVNQNAANGIATLATAYNNEVASREAADTAINNKLAQDKTDTALHVTKDGNLIVGTKENQTVKDVKIRGQLTSGSVSTGNITATGDAKVAGKVEAEAVYDDTTKPGNYVVQTNSVGSNLSVLDTQVKANADAVATKANAADVYTKTETDSKVDAVKKEATTYTYRKVAAEEAARKAADNELNERITNEANAIHETTNQLQSDLSEEAKTRESKDNELNERITNEANAIHDEIKAGDTALDNRITAVKESLQQEAADTYVSKADAAVQDGAIVKADKTIGENVTNLDAALAKETADRLGADKAQDKVIQQVNQNMVDGFNTINKNMADGFTALNNADLKEAQERVAADTVLDDKITAETSARVVADTKLVEATNGGVSLSDDNVLQKNTTTIDAQGNVTTSKTDANEMILKNKDNQITLNEKGIKVGTNSSVMDKDGVYTGGDTYSEAKAAMSSDGQIKGANGKFTVDASGNTTVTSLDAGTGTIQTKGDLYAKDATFSGDITAKDATLSGDLSAKDGTFSGDLSAKDGTFSGDVSAKDVTATGTLQGAEVTDGTATLKQGKLTGVKDIETEALHVNGDANVTGKLTTKDLEVTGEFNANTLKSRLDENNYTEIHGGNVTSKNLKVDKGVTRTSESSFDENGREEYVTDNDSRATVKVGANEISQTLDDKGNNPKNEASRVLSQNTDNKYEITDSVVEGNQSNVENRTADTTDSQISFKDDSGKVLNKSYITQNLKKVLMGVEEGDNKTTIEQNANNITNTAKNGTITNDAGKLVNTASESVTTQIGDGSEVQSVMNGGGIANKATGKSITNDAATITNTGTTSVTNQVGNNKVLVDTTHVQSAFGDTIYTTWDESGITNNATDKTVETTAKDIKNTATGDISNTASTGTITNDAKTLLNKASESITDKVGDNVERTMTTKQIQDKVGKTTVTTIDGKTTLTNEDGTHRTEMDFADVLKDLGVRGNATVDGNTTLGTDGKDTLTVNSTSTFKEKVTMEKDLNVKSEVLVNEGDKNQVRINTNGITVGLNSTVVDSEGVYVGGHTFEAAKAGMDKDGKLKAANGNFQVDTKGNVSAVSYTVKDTNIKIDNTGINAGGTKVTGLAPADINHAGSTEAVSGGQLYETNTRVSGLETRMGTVETRVDKLDNKIDKVGANAAAMANLHPLEFDEDSKWNIAAAVGSSGSETASAVGVFYRPNENVMVNASAAMGTGENMFGGGVSLRLGHGGNKAKEAQMKAAAAENKELRAKVDDLTARMDALLSVLNPNMSKDFPDVPENHWAYEAVSRLAGNGIVEGYEDGKYHGERQMTRYEMAEIIYNALSKGAKAEKKLVEEFRPELQAMAAQKRA